MNLQFDIFALFHTFFFSHGISWSKLSELFLPRQTLNKIAKNIATENCLFKRKTFLTRSWTGVNSYRIENEITSNKFAFHYDARSTSECSVRRLKIHPAAGWWHVSVSFVNISGQIPGCYLKIGKGCFMPCFLLSNDSWSCSRSARSYVTTVLDIAVSYYLILYLNSSVICHILPRNLKNTKMEQFLWSDRDVYIRGQERARLTTCQGTKTTLAH